MIGVSLNAQMETTLLQTLCVKIVLQTALLASFQQLTVFPANNLLSLDS